MPRKISDLNLHICALSVFQGIALESIGFGIESVLSQNPDKLQKTAITFVPENQ